MQREPDLLCALQRVIDRHLQPLQCLPTSSAVLLSLRRVSELLVGRPRNPHATQLNVLADCGGSNGYRPQAWKYGLQHRFCNPHGLTVVVADCPPRQSNHNPIEHRLFSEISKNWAGRPLLSWESIINFEVVREFRTVR